MIRICTKAQKIMQQTFNSKYAVRMLPFDTEVKKDTHFFICTYKKTKRKKTKVTLLIVWINSPV